MNLYEVNAELRRLEQRVIAIEAEADARLRKVEAQMGRERESLDDIEKGPPGHGLQPYVWAQTKTGLK